MRTNLRIFFTIFGGVLFFITSVNNAAAQDVGWYGPIWIFFIPIGLIWLFIIWIQFLLTKKGGFKTALIVWGIYPILFCVWIFTTGYQALFYDKFKSRQFDLQLAEITNVYLVKENPYNRNTDNLFIKFLMGAKNNSIVEAGIGRYENGIKMTLKNGGDCFTNSANIHKRLTRKLISNGYLDKCVLSRKLYKGYTIDYDIKIRSSSDLKRFLGPCCIISEIHTNHDGKDVYIGRWEYLGSSYKRGYPGGYFTFLDIISNLTGKKYGQRIKPYQFNSLSDELLRISDALGTPPLFKERRQAILYWLERGVFGFDYRKAGHELTDEEFRSLKGLIALLSTQEKTKFTQRYGYRISNFDKERLQSWIKDN